MGIKLYSWPRSSASRVHWALEELGVPFELVTLDRHKGEHQAPTYLAINPNGKVPALVDDGQPYFESTRAGTFPFGLIARYAGAWCSPL